jgi:hypothetical protein
MLKADFDPFDPRSLTLPPEELVNIQITKVTSTRRPSKGCFLMRVPWRWLEQASRLPGSCVAVGLLVWHQSNLRKRRTFTFCLVRGEALNVSEKATRAALHQLEAAGLVAITRKPGRGLEVTLLEHKA